MQLTLGVNVLEMKTDVLLNRLEQDGQVLLRKPNDLSFKSHVDLQLPLLRLANEELAFRWRRCFGIFAHGCLVDRASSGHGFDALHARPAEEPPQTGREAALWSGAGESYAGRSWLDARINLSWVGQPTDCAHYDPGSDEVAQRASEGPQHVRR